MMSLGRCARMLFGFLLPVFLLFGSQMFLHYKAQKSETIEFTDMPTNVINADAAHPVRKWAYAFLVGGCSEDYPGHVGIVANIAIAAYRLRQSNSTADVVALVQMSHDAKEDVLPEVERRLLAAIPGLKVKYIPPFSDKVHQNFYTLMMEKFRILDLTEYSRVLFLDGDILPLRSLDYLFDFSEPDPASEKPALLRENIILTGNTDPATGGFFMLKPNRGDFLRSNEIIERVERAALDQPWPHWDPIVGWGHVIEPTDKWLSSVNVERQTGAILPRTNWTWHGSFADQGFLYYWVKYEKKSVSIITNDKIDNYANINGTAHLLRTFYNRESETPEKILVPGILNGYTNRSGLDLSPRKSAPYCDFHHFTGDYKPWYFHDRKVNIKPKRNKARRDPKRDKQVALLTELWFASLEEIEKIANVTMKFPETDKSPPLGKYPVFNQRIVHIRRKAEHNFKMYAEDFSTVATATGDTKLR